MIKIKEHPDLFKDEKTKAVLNNNKKALEEHKAKKLFFSTIVDRINNVEKRMIDIEEKLQKLLKE